VAGVLFGSFAMVGSQIREGNWTSILSEFTCVVDVNLATLSWLLSCPGLNVGRSFSQPLHWWDSSCRLQKVMQYADGEGQCCFLCSHDHTYAWDVRVHGWSAWPGSSLYFRHFIC
jgi:hypothetical protein